MLNKHYSPKTRFIVTDNIKLEIKKYKNNNVGFLTHSDTDLKKNVIQITTNGDLYEAAKNLYDAMHQLDSLQYDLIIAEKFIEYGIGISLNDRLCRAQVT